MLPRSTKRMTPSTLANSVSSLPRPTFLPGFRRVPRWRTMIEPPVTSCPPKAFTPSRCAFESRPFLELPNPFLCAISVSQNRAAEPRSRAASKLFFLSRLLRCPRRALVGTTFAALRRLAFGSGAALLLCLLLGLLAGHFFLFLFRLCCRLIGSGELLPVEGDLGDANGGEWLSMSLQLLVLLLALEVEYQDLIGASFFYHAAHHARATLRTHQRARLAGNRQHVSKLHVAVFCRLLIDPDYVSGCDAKLLSPGADNRVHRLFLLSRKLLADSYQPLRRG